VEGIYVKARLRIHDGQLDAFKAFAKQALEVVREKDTATHQYDWFFNADELECVVLEHYADSQAILDHAAHGGHLLGRLTELADMSFEFYGAPSTEVLDAVADFKPATYTYFQGL